MRTECGIDGCQLTSSSIGDAEFILFVNREAFLRLFTWRSAETHRVTEVVSIYSRGPVPRESLKRASSSPWVLDSLAVLAFTALASAFLAGLIDPGRVALVAARDRDGSTTVSGAALRDAFASGRLDVSSSARFLFLSFFFIFVPEAAGVSEGDLIGAVPLLLPFEAKISSISVLGMARKRERRKKCTRGKKHLHFLVTCHVQVTGMLIARQHTGYSQPKLCYSGNHINSNMFIPPSPGSPAPGTALGPSREA